MERNGGKERGGQRGRERERMGESSLTQGALMSDLALQLGGHFVQLTDRQQGPGLFYLSPFYSPLHPPIPLSLPLYLSIFLSATVQQPLILLLHINQCRQAGREGEREDDSSCSASGAVSTMSGRGLMLYLFMHLFMYLLGRAAPLLLSHPLSLLPLRPK